MESTKLNAELFLETRHNIPLADVRTPLEFAHGHIPGANLFPLFSNEERAEVGKLYAIHGNEKAIEKGYEIAGPKLADYLREATRIAPNRELYMYCWRGGMRSSSLAWLLGFSGFKVSILEGGYKAYRGYCRSNLNKPASIILLGGYTGTGKSEVLDLLEERGEQVLKLERLANHKGSAFGGIGEMNQPSQEQFENMISECWITYDLIKQFGLKMRVLISENFRFQESCLLNGKAAVIVLEDEKEKRISRLVTDYESASIEEFIQVFQRISKRIGLLNSKEAIESVERKELSKAVDIALKYYDKAYSEKLDCRNRDSLYHINYKESKEATIDSLIILRNKIEDNINGKD